MKIAVDISPISSNHNSGHKVRGVGSYINLLKNNLPKIDKKNDYFFFTSKHELSQDIDLIHYPYFEPFFRSLPLFTNVPFVVTIHDIIPLKFPEHFPAGFRGKTNLYIQKNLLLRSKAVITDSAVSRKDIHELLKVPLHKIHVVYLAAVEEYRRVDDEKKLNQIKEKYNLPKEFALYVGDATWNKNLPKLIDAIKKSKMPLVMVGKSLTEKVADAQNLWNKDLIDVQSQTQNDSLFIKLGFIPLEDLAVLYNLATLCIMPSLYEGFGLPVLEAMQSGCPVITSKNSSLQEIGGDAVFYIDPYSTESIVKGITKLKNDKKVRQELTFAGPTQAKEFTIKKTIDETISVYEKSIV